MSSDFWTGVVVALVVGVAANLIAPFTRNALLVVIASSARIMRAVGSRLRGRALLSLERELALLEELQSKPVKLALVLVSHVALSQLFLWLLVYGFAVAYLFGWHIDRDAMLLYLFSFIGASSFTFFSLVVTLVSIDRLRDFPAYKARVEKQIAVLRQPHR